MMRALPGGAAIPMAASCPHSCQGSLPQLVIAPAASQRGPIRSVVAVHWMVGNCGVVSRRSVFGVALGVGSAGAGTPAAPVGDDAGAAAPIAKTRSTVFGVPGGPMIGIVTRLSPTGTVVGGAAMPATC